MKKHVEFDHSTLLEKLLEDPINLAPRSPLNHEFNKKRAHVSLSTTFSFFFRLVSSRKMMQVKLFVIKRLMFMRTVKLI